MRLPMHVVEVEHVVVALLRRRAAAQRLRRQKGTRRLGSTCCAAGTETSSFSGQRSAVSLPPNTQPVSMLIVRFSHSGSGTGVWP